MKNQPYVKERDSDGKITNAITKENPYMHKYPSTSYQKSLFERKYIVFHHPITGEFIGKVKTMGNNRENSCPRKGKNSRNKLKQ